MHKMWQVIVKWVEGQHCKSSLLTEVYSSRVDAIEAAMFHRMNNLTLGARYFVHCITVEEI